MFRGSLSQRGHLSSSGICLASIKQSVQKVSGRFATSRFAASLSKVSVQNWARKPLFLKASSSVASYQLKKDLE